MRYSDNPSTNGIPTGLGNTVYQLGMSGPDQYGKARLIAELLMTGDLAPTAMWVPERDPEPGSQVTRIFTGRHHYVRTDDGRWTRESEWPSKINARVWVSFGARIVINSTPSPGAERPGTWNPGGPVADWHTTSPDEAAVMLGHALEEMRRRRAAGAAKGVLATRWRPADRGPIYLICLGEPGDQDTTVIADRDDPACE